jgi:hypothetical protein
MEPFGENGDPGDRLYDLGMHMYGDFVEGILSTGTP